MRQKEGIASRAGPGELTVGAMPASARSEAGATRDPDCQCDSLCEEVNAIAHGLLDTILDAHRPFIQPALHRLR